MVECSIILFGSAFTFWVLKYPKRFLYFYVIYLFLVQLYFIYFSNPLNVDSARVGGFRLDFLGGFTGNTILLIYLILVLVNKMLSSRVNVKQFFKLPGFKLLCLYTVLIIVTVVLQYLFLDLSVHIAIRKITGNITFPLLLISILFYFKYKDSKNLLKLCVLSFIIVFFVFFIKRFIPYLSTFSGIDFNNRLSGLLYFSSNGTAAFLGIFLPIIFYKYKSSSGSYKILWFVLILITGTCMVFTFTRAVFIALIFSIIVYVTYFIKNPSKRILVVCLLILTLACVGGDLLNVITRGQTDIISNLSDPTASTLAYRINMYWKPTINITKGKLPYFLIGTPFRGFNQFLYSTIGVNRANHNIFIQHLANFGIIVTVIYGLFWYKLLLAILRKAKSNMMDAQLDVYILLSLIIFFISINAMNIYSSPFLNPIAILIFIYYSGLSRNWNE